jgi:hypothetical protein
VFDGGGFFVRYVGLAGELVVGTKQVVVFIACNSNDISSVKLIVIYQVH